MTPDQKTLVAAFNEGYRGLSESKAYRELIRSAFSDLPPWMVHLSFVSLADLNRIAEALALAPGERFVDLACGLGGPGIWLAERTGASLVGVDFSEAAVEAAKRLASQRTLQERARFVVADATQTGLPDEAFAGLVSIDALQMMEPYAAILEIHRLLRPGGIVATTTWEATSDEAPRPTMVRDYRPIFREGGLELQAYEVILGARDRELSFFTAVVERTADLKRELGPAAEHLLNEASENLARAEDPPRTRRVRIIAKKA
jgi:SAM-dependent methyltransferase